MVIESSMYIEGLTEANLTYEAVRAGVKYNKGLQARKLNSYGIFSDQEIAVILDTSAKVVVNGLNRSPKVAYTPHIATRQGNGFLIYPFTLPVLRTLAIGYHTDNSVSVAPAQVLAHTIPRSIVSRLTGIPEETLRKVANGGKPYLSGVFVK